MGLEPRVGVLVVGTGGVGTMTCVALERSGRATVTAVLRSNYEQLKNHGFEIESCDHGKLSGWRPSRMPDTNPAEPFDYIVVSMKNIPEVSNITDTHGAATAKLTRASLEEIWERSAQNHTLVPVSVLHTQLMLT